MKYDAFISYSHQIDSNLAPAIQRSLEKFAKPLFATKALKIFRDLNDLSASPDLWGSIEKGLNNSECTFCKNCNKYILFLLFSTNTFCMVYLFLININAIPFQ